MNITKLNKAERIVLALFTKGESVAWIASKLNKPGEKVTAAQVRKVQVIIASLAEGGLINA